MLSTLRSFLSPRGVMSMGINVARRYLATTSLNVSHWSSGSDWDIGHLVQLGLQPQFEQSLDQMLPIRRISFNNLHKSILTPFGNAVFNYGHRDSNEIEKFLFNNLMGQAAVVEDSKNEDLTFQFVSTLLTLFNIPSKKSQLQLQVIKRFPIGNSRIVTKLDAVVGKEIESGVGMEDCIIIAFPSLKIDDENLCDQEFRHAQASSTEPQIGAHLLGMAMMIFGKRMWNMEPITVHLIEVQGCCFTFWKATLPCEYLLVVAKGDSPETVVPLFFHQKTAHIRYKFTNPDDRKIILELLGTYFSYAVPEGNSV